MSWVYLLVKLTEMQMVLTREMDLAGSSDSLTVHLTDWTKVLHLVDLNELLRVWMTH